MTNAIEQAKREMFQRIANIRGRHVNNGYEYLVHGEIISKMEGSLESYLELLRQDQEALHETARKRFEDLQKAEAANQDLTERLAKMTEDRDGCQSRMQAIDHAYNEQQQKKTGTCGQVCGDRGASERTDAKDSNLMAILGAVIDCQQLVSDWAIYGYRAKKQMKKMAYVLNKNPELRAALDHFEGKA